MARVFDPIPLFETATFENFDEAGYLAANPDVAAAVEKGSQGSGWAHFLSYGHREKRKIRLKVSLEAVRRFKMHKAMSIIDLRLPHVRCGYKLDFLTSELRKETGISDTNAVSSNEYDEFVTSLISELKDGLILDCGAGFRNVYFHNVINYEIVDYDTTDIIGVGERLPFHNNTLDAVISIAVLEHVRNPFQCAAEIVRVLKPGGRLLCCVPFLQPEHGYPHHYYNMTKQGLRALFDRALVIDDQKVVSSLLPVWSLTWIVSSWAAGLPSAAREEFLSMPLSELLQDPSTLLNRRWVIELPTGKNFELASATLLFAHKPIQAMPDLEHPLDR